MLAGSLAMLAFVERSLTAQAADGAEVRAAELVASPGAPSGVIDVIDPTEEFVQVLHDGTIVAASDNVRGLPPLASPSPGEHVRLDQVPFTNAPFIVASAARGNLTAFVGRNIDDEIDARNTVRKALLLGGRCDRSRTSAKRSSGSPHESWIDGCRMRPGATRWLGSRSP